MSRKYKFKDPDKLYFVSYAVVYWIDLFIREEYREILIKSWKHCMDTKGLEIYGWCIMTSHVHMIIGSNKERPENIMRDFKKYTSEELKNAIQHHTGESRKEWMLWMMERAGIKNSNNNKFQLWQQDNHPILLYDQTIAWQKLNYIHNNPVEAGIVARTEDYKYSSAKDYLNKPGLFEIKLLDPELKVI